MENLRRFLIATVAIVFAAFLQVQIEPLTGQLQFLLFYPTVFMMAWYFRLATGLYALGLAAYVSHAYFFLPRAPENLSSSAAWFRLFFFVVNNLVIIWLVHRGQKTERVVSEQAHQIEATERRFQNIANSAPVMIWVSEGKGLEIAWFNRAWLDFTGLELESARGLTWMRLVHPDDVQKCSKTALDAIQKREAFFVEARLLSKLGQYHWTRTHALPRFDAKGDLEGLVGSTFDIHDIIQAEDELKSAVRVRDEFLSLASHELKTPLTTLNLQVQLFERQARKGEASYSKQRIDELISISSRQILRLSRLVDDMLDVSRIRSGRLSLRREKMDLRDLVLEAMQRLRVQFGVTGKAFPTFEAHGSFVGEWDRTRLEQVIANLLTNAIKYGEGKPIEISLVDLKTHVQLRIRDHGIGIDIKDQEKIFGRFERAVNANEVSGLGLGLFITRQIVQAHGGHISVESQLGHGATFVVDLMKLAPSTTQPESVALV